MEIPLPQMPSEDMEIKSGIFQGEGIIGEDGKVSANPSPVGNRSKKS
jgi:hypothetical protein